MSSSQRTVLLRELFRTVDRTIVGETLDVLVPLTGPRNARTALRIAALKTADYSFVMPLTFGLLLGGARPAAIRSIGRYAHNLGMAFQIDDDIIGAFGDVKQSGKSASADLEEGKVTLLTAGTMQRLGKQDRLRFRKILGQSRLLAADLKWVRRQMVVTGALEAVRREQLRLVTRAQRRLQYIKLPPAARVLFEQLAEAVVNRQT